LIYLKINFLIQRCQMDLIIQLDRIKINLNLLLLSFNFLE
jgi:hypothetical protein